MYSNFRLSSLIEKSIKGHKRILRIHIKWLSSLPNTIQNKWPKLQDKWQFYIFVHPSVLVHALIDVRMNDWFRILQIIFHIYIN